MRPLGPYLLTSVHHLIPLTQTTHGDQQRDHHRGTAHLGHLPTSIDKMSGTNGLGAEVLTWAGEVGRPNLAREVLLKDHTMLLSMAHEQLRRKDRELEPKTSSRPHRRLRQDQVLDILLQTSIGVTGSPLSQLQRPTMLVSAQILCSTEKVEHQLGIPRFSGSCTASKLLRDHGPKPEHFQKTP